MGAGSTPIDLTSTVTGKHEHEHERKYEHMKKCKRKGGAFSNFVDALVLL